MFRFGGVRIGRRPGSESGDVQMRFPLLSTVFRFSEVERRFIGYLLSRTVYVSFLAEFPFASI